MLNLFHFLNSIVSPLTFNSQAEKIELWINVTSAVSNLRFFKRINNIFLRVACNAFYALSEQALSLKTDLRNMVVSYNVIVYGFIFSCGAPHFILRKSSTNSLSYIHLAALLPDGKCHIYSTSRANISILYQYIHRVSNYSSLTDSQNQFHQKLFKDKF